MLSILFATFFYSLRIADPEFSTPGVWDKLEKEIAAHPGLCDETWFDALEGFPILEAHHQQAAKMIEPAAAIRKLGIAVSIEMCSLGHGDIFMKCDVGAVDNWGVWTGSTGVACKECFCPRDEKVVKYLSEVAAIYCEAIKPDTLWIDDDLRAINHRPATDGSLMGCWCERCVGDFAKQEGKQWKREELAKACKDDAKLFKRWEEFQFGSLAEVARSIAKEVLKVSPDTRFGIEQCAWHDDGQAVIYEALKAESGKATRCRPGGGAYADYDPYRHLEKAYGSNWQKKTLENAPIEQFLHEIETYPRMVGMRTGKGVILEELEAFAAGCDAMSFFIMATYKDPAKEYGERLFKPIAEKRKYIEAFVKANEGTLPAGLRHEWIPPWPALVCGVPFANGVCEAFGEYPEFVKANGGKKIDAREATMEDILGWYKLADKLCGGKMPILLEKPERVFVLPRVTKGERKLKTVLIVNVSIDDMRPMKVKLRNLVGEKVVWHPLEGEEQELAITQEDGEKKAVIPKLSPWSAGWLEFKQ